MTSIYKDQTGNTCGQREIKRPAVGGADPIPARKRPSRRGHKYRNTPNDKRREIIRRVMDQGASIRKVAFFA